jgi:flagellar basal body-associated protein FliL
MGTYSESHSSGKGKGKLVMIQLIVATMTLCCVLQLQVRFSLRKIAYDGEALTRRNIVSNLWSKMLD